MLPVPNKYTVEDNVDHKKDIQRVRWGLRQLHGDQKIERVVYGVRPYHRDTWGAQARGSFVNEPAFRLEETPSKASICM